MAITNAEKMARHAGRTMGITFREYEHWGTYSIKAYGPNIPLDNAPDFQDWEQAKPGYWGF